MRCACSSRPRKLMRYYSSKIECHSDCCCCFASRRFLFVCASLNLATDSRLLFFVCVCRQRDDMEVLDEPLYANFLRATGVDRPYRQELLSKMVRFSTMLSLQFELPGRLELRLVSSS